MTMDTFPRVLTVRQYEPIPNLRLTDIQPRLAGKLLGKYVALSSRNSAESLSALGNIGIFRLDPETLLNIVPRFDTRNLTYMVEACEGSWVNVIDGMMREYPTGGSAQEWLSTVLRTQYVKRCTSLYTTGLLRGYRRKHVVTSSPCGRIEMGRSISLKARGIVGTKTSANGCWNCLMVSPALAGMIVGPMISRKAMPSFRKTGISTANSSTWPG